MNTYVVLGVIVFILGIVAAAYHRGTQNADKKLVEKHDAEKDAARRKLRQDAIKGQEIQEDTFNMPIDAVREELKRRAGK